MDKPAVDDMVSNKRNNNLIKFNFWSFLYKDNSFVQRLLNIMHVNGFLQKCCDVE